MKMIYEHGLDFFSQIPHPCRTLCPSRRILKPMKPPSRAIAAAPLPALAWGCFPQRCKHPSKPRNREDTISFCSSISASWLMTVANLCHQNKTNANLRGTGLINLYGQQLFAAALCVGTIVGARCILFSIKVMLLRKSHLQAIRLLHYYCGKRSSDSRGSLKTMAESAPRFQRFVLAAATCKSFLLQQLQVNLFTIINVGT